MGEFQGWKSVGSAIGQMIRKRGYRSLELFAHEQGIDKSVLSRLVKGEREVRLSTFLKILDGLEISLGELLGHQKPSQKTRAHQVEIQDRIAKLSLEDVDRIEIRKSSRDKKPLIIEVSKAGKLLVSGI